MASSNGTAIAGSDYTAINQTVTFAKGETSKTVSITALSDSSVESDETFNLTLSASTSDVVPAQISDGSASVTIQNVASNNGNVASIRGNSFYKIISAQSWSDAESQANSIGGNLITINNLDEYNWASQNVWSNANLLSLIHI